MSVPAKLQTRFMQLDDVRLAYWEEGSGQLVLSAHGLTASRAAAARLGLADFTPVSEHARLVTYDARGHGESSGAPEPRSYAWDALADDMLALADRLSPNTPISAIGLSMGTGTLLHAAVKRPDRFERLVLTAPPTAWQTRAGQAQLYENIAKSAEDSTPQALLAFFEKSVVAPIFRDVPGYPVDPDIPHALIPAVFRGAGLSDLPPPHALSALSQPTLILAWDTDPGHPVSTAQRLSELLPSAQLHVSQTAGDIRTWGARAAAFLAETT